MINNIQLTQLLDLDLTATQLVPFLNRRATQNLVIIASVAKLKGLLKKCHNLTIKYQKQLILKNNKGLSSPQSWLEFHF